MVTFRCLRSGNTVSFTDEGDIAGLRTHEGYEEILNEIEINEDANEESDVGDSSESEDEDRKENGIKGKEKGNVLKKRGRPKK